MSNTQFFQKAVKDGPHITYKDILSESFRKHTMKDVEYALSAGTSYDLAGGGQMLDRWNKPWLWFYCFCAAFIVSFTLYLLTACFPEIPAFGWTSVIFATLVTPIPFMIFLWELNIPRNISFLLLAGCFVAGGILSIFFSAVLFKLDFSGAGAWWAPLAEEPGKLLASWLLIEYLNRKGKRIYGCTGLVIGAGVGAGFTVFETLGKSLDHLTRVFFLQIGGYVSGSGINTAAIEALYVVLIRSVPCLAAHLLYCAPYVGAMSLAYHRSHSWEASFKDKGFRKYFFLSVVLHAVWNETGSIDGVPGWCIRTGIAFCSFYALARVIQQCLTQVVGECRPVDPVVTVPLFGKGISLYCGNASGKGMVRKSDGAPIIVGRDRTVCNLCYPDQTRGVSRRHCRVFYYGSDWYVQDIGSSYGTYVRGKGSASVKKLSKGESLKLSQGDRIYLGSEKVFLTVM